MVGKVEARRAMAGVFMSVDRKIDVGMVNGCRVKAGWVQSERRVNAGCKCRVRSGKVGSDFRR